MCRYLLEASTLRRAEKGREGVRVEGWMGVSAGVSTVKKEDNMIVLVLC
jgi:hypothetical protein